jgi:hypothetical protein
MFAIKSRFYTPVWEIPAPPGATADPYRHVIGFKMDGIFQRWYIYGRFVRTSIEYKVKNKLLPAPHGIRIF